MKKIAITLAIISIITFIITWGIGGLKLYNHEYESFSWLYIGIISILTFFITLIYLKVKKSKFSKTLSKNKWKRQSNMKNIAFFYEKIQKLIEPNIKVEFFYSYKVIYNILIKKGDIIYDICKFNWQSI